MKQLREFIENVTKNVPPFVVQGIKLVWICHSVILSLCHYITLSIYLFENESTFVSIENHTP